MSGRTDSETGERLLARHRSGDPSALAVLMSQYGALVSTAARRGGCPDRDVEDIVQETWWSFVRHADDITSPGALSAWLWQTAKRHGHVAARRVGRCIPTEFNEATHSGNDGSEHDDIIDRMTTDAATPALRGAVGRLGEREQKLVVLLFGDAPKDYRSIAAEINRGVGAIGPTRGRMLDKLRTDARLRAAYLVA
ncbi:MAG: sigma-70 family RNA polymerase sigma factor [Acidimicrobiia bacterium]|nr:sigma-70 family RNA polymerase sigma factor [Acidimicrobiia bacterium]